MVTMKGHTSSLRLLLLLVLFCGASKGQTGEPPKTDYLPTEANMILLPTTVGTYDMPTTRRIRKVPNNKYGILKDAYMKCGKRTVNINTDLELPSTTSTEIGLDCFPNPQRVVLSAGPLSISFAEVDLKECQGLQTCATVTDLSNVNHGNGFVVLSNTALNPLDAAHNLCVDAPPSDKILFSNEIGCVNPGVISDAATALKPGAKETFIVPRWKTDNNGFFEVLRSFTINAGKGRNPEAKVLPRTNNFIDFPEPSTLAAKNDWQPCTASCNKGNIIKMNMDNKGGWKTVIYLTKKAQGFKVCIDAEGHDEDTTTPKCKPRFELFILPRNGLVIWPKTGRASVIQLKSGENNYAIEFGYGYDKGNGDAEPEFYVANMYREMVMSDSGGWDAAQASKVSFFFHEANDLVPEAGIFSEQIQTASTYIDKTITVDNKPVVNKQSGISVKKGNESLVNVYDPIIPNVFSTTPASKRLSSNVHPGVLLQSTDNNNDAVFMPGKWWAWGIYIGFICGSIIGVAILGGVFYLIRRTVYGFWYRGMFKRYGCDVSGTTGGITGVGFGNTTTGAITVGGTTGGGGTTMGTTGTTGSMTKTGGGTTGTTGSVTSTGGASTIAM